MREASGLSGPLPNGQDGEGEGRAAPPLVQARGAPATALEGTGCSWPRAGRCAPLPPEHAPRKRLTDPRTSPARRIGGSGASIVTRMLGPAFDRRGNPALHRHRRSAEGTTLGALGVGETVNIEVDVVARYVERLLRKS